MAAKTSTLDGGIGLIEVKGSLIGGDETDDLRRAIAGFADQEYHKLIIDMSKVTYLNSTGIGVLVAAQASYARKGWKIKLVGINKNIDNLFVLTKLTMVFEISETREQAIKELK
ncbi:MAG: STAS domain-containing protein [Bacteroidota bacterium]